MAHRDRHRRLAHAARAGDRNQAVGFQRLRNDLHGKIAASHPRQGREHRVFPHLVGVDVAATIPCIARLCFIELTPGRLLKAPCPRGIDGM